MIVVPFAVRRPQPDLDPQERLPDDPVIREPRSRLSNLRLKNMKINEPHSLFVYRVGTPFASGSTGLRW